MVEYKSDANKEIQLDLVFHALADRTRRSLLSQMRDKPMRVTQLAEEYDCSLNAISKHLKVLEKAHLIHRVVKGRVHLCSPNPEEMVKAQKWIDLYTRFWSDKLDNLDKVLTKNSKQKREKKK